MNTNLDLAYSYELSLLFLLLYTNT